MQLTRFHWVPGRMSQIFQILRSALSRIQSCFVTPRSAQGQIIQALDETLRQRRTARADAILLIVEIDDFDVLQSQLTLAELELSLQSLERRLKGGLLARDMIRRLDGGRFGCVLSPMHGYCAEDVLIIAGQVQNLIAVPVVMRDTSAKVSVSIGCAMAEMATLTTGEMMFEAAHLALIEALGKGPAGLQFYADPMGEQLSLRRALHRDAEAALHSGAIHAHFQPQINLVTGEISGFEALARWAHRDRGLISPFEFLPVFEESGMMRPLGRVMLKDALKALVAWDAAGLHVPRVSVNMCAEELRHRDVVEDVSFQLKHFNIRPKRLVIEVLESVYVDRNDDPIIQNLGTLSALGCKIDLDDFGTGQASLKSVQRFAVNRVKIDRSFITDVDTDEEQQQVVQTILSMAEIMKVATLAEGVETQAEIDHLSKIGCGHAQGFAISRPLPFDQTVTWIKARTKPTVAENVS